MNSSQHQAQRKRERTAFQTPHYHESIDLRADVVFVYGQSSTLSERVKTWRERGYRVHFMTGAAWGHYHDYLDGTFDGQPHWHEAQVARNGERIDHGNEIFYIVPTSSYINYLKTLMERAIDAGVDALHLEEPEFWSRGGYSEAFQASWLEHYGKPWQPPHDSPAAWYAAANLKYLLYTELLDDVFQHAKRYAANLGRELHCYVDSHSTLNYAQWGIVSPASNLAQLSACDGYVCQVWTGTARTPNHLRGVRSERTFLTSYLEYAQMAAMVAATKRKIWFLADPIEDDPDYDWNDYRHNYHATLIASLLHPNVNSFEVMPWPDRVLNHAYPQHVPEIERSKIPEGYARELLTISNALSDMDGDLEVIQSGTQRIGLCVADTLLFERGFLEPERTPLRKAGEHKPPDQIYRLTHDTEMDGIFGLALPFVEAGIPLRFVHLEHVGLPDAFEDFDVLVLSYDDLKPPSAQAHEALAAWVRAGGVLVYWGNPNALAFDDIPSFWRDAGFEKPIHHLLDLLDVETKPGLQRSGQGTVLWVGTPAGEVARDSKLADNYLETIQQAHEAGRTRAGAWHTANAFVLRRGPYVVMAGLSDADYSQEGKFIDLLSDDLTILERVTLKPNEHRLLYDLAHRFVNRRAIVATGRIESESSDERGTRVFITCPTNIRGCLIVALGEKPKRILLDNHETQWTWDEDNKLVRIFYDGKPEGLELWLE